MPVSSPDALGDTTMQPAIETVGLRKVYPAPKVPGRRARVDGVEVSAQPVEVRRRIGVVPQRPNPDRSLNVRENLLFHASYFGIPKSVAAPRADGLMKRLGFADKAEAKVDALSGGQQQRLM